MRLSQAILSLMLCRNQILRGVASKVRQSADGPPRRCQQSCAPASCTRPRVQLCDVIAAYSMNPIGDASGVNAVTGPLPLLRMTPLSLTMSRIQVADERHQRAQQDDFKIRHVRYSPPNQFEPRSLQGAGVEGCRNINDRARIAKSGFGASGRVLAIEKMIPQSRVVRLGSHSNGPGRDEG